MNRATGSLNASEHRSNQGTRAGLFTVALVLTTAILSFANSPTLAARSSIDIHEPMSADEFEAARLDKSFAE